MKTKQLLFLGITNVLMFFFGFGVFPLLPVYASELGASRTVVGLYLALLQLAVATGTMLPARFAAFTPRKVYAFSAATGTAALLLLATAGSLWQLVAFTFPLWLLGGLVISTSSVLTGVLGGKEKAGRSFSLLSLAMPIGSLLGGLVAGRLVSWQGYGGLFAVLAGLWLLAHLPPIFGLEVPELPRHAPRRDRATTGPAAVDHWFYLLLAAVLIGGLSISVGRVGAPLAMAANNFSPTAITGSAAVAGLVAIPLILLLGDLSDRLGRKPFLTLGYVLVGLGSLTLVAAAQLWHYWLATALILTGRIIDDAMAAAVATEILPPAALPQRIPQLKLMNRLGGIASFAGAGLALDLLGATDVLLISGGLALVAASIPVLLRMRGRIAGMPAWSQLGALPVPTYLVIRRSSSGKPARLSSSK